MLTAPKDGGPASHTMTVPVIKRREYQLLMISEDGFLSLFSLENGNTKEDVKLPEGGVGEKITAMFRVERKDVNVVVLSAMGKEIALDCVEKLRE